MENTYMIVDGELYHYGIPGMKWGVRKAREYTSKSDAARKTSDMYESLSKNAVKSGNVSQARKYRRVANKYQRKADKYQHKADEVLFDSAAQVTSEFVGKFAKAGSKIVNSIKRPSSKLTGGKP